MDFSSLLPVQKDDLRTVVRALGIPALHQVASGFATELRRARRYERPLSVLVVSSQGENHLRGDAAAHDPIPLRRVMPPTLFSFVFLGSFLRKALREDDILATAAEGLRYVVILPEADERSGKGAIGRLRRDFAAYAALPLCAGLSVFPHDGLVAETLLDHAHRTWQTGIVEDTAPAIGPGAAEAREASGA